MREYFLFSITLLTLFGCKKNEELKPTSSSEIIISKDLYDNAPRNEFYFRNVAIENNLLKIKLDYSGGCGGIAFNLIAPGYVLETDSVQNNLRLSFEDKDNCERMIERKLVYDLTPIRIAEANLILINLEGWDRQLVWIS